MAKLGWHDDLSSATAIWVRSGKAEWVYQGKSRSIESHDPADRVGGPYRLYDFVDEGSGEHLFIFAVVDSHFPAHDLVRADSEQDAYEAYIDWAAKHRNIAIEEPDLKDYDPDQLHYTSDGVPVDDENVNMQEVEFVRADGIRKDEEEEEVAENPRRGPGKFDSDLDAAIYSMSLDGGPDEEVGEAESFGWYGLMRNLTAKEVEDHARELGLDMPGREELADVEGKSAIIFENDQGFVEVDLFLPDKAEQRWAKLEEEYEAEAEETEET